MKSLLFVPANKSNRFVSDFLKGKFHTQKPSALIFDLEDSIPDNSKKQAAEMLRSVLDESAGKLAQHTEIYVRINGIDSDFFEQDLEILGNHAGDTAGIMLSKCSSGAAVQMLCSLIHDRKTRRIIPLIETLTGYENRREIMSFANEKGYRLIAFGAGDMSLELGIERNYDLVVLQKIIADLLIEARINNVFLIDSPSRILPSRGESWKEDLLKECNWAFENGFYAKMAVHPAQVESIENVFSKKTDDEWAEEIIRHFDNAAQTNAIRNPATGDYIGLPVLKSAKRKKYGSDASNETKN